MSKKLREVNIVKTEGGWNVVGTKKNNIIGFCTSLRTTIDTCLESYELLNFGYALDELYKLENN